MANELTLNNIQVPAHVAARMGTVTQLAASLAAGLSSSTPKISIKAGRFRIVEGSVETLIERFTLPVVIVGANPAISKQFYAGKWNEDVKPAEPDCHSLDGVAPDVSVAAPVNNLCATCPNNAWGSEISPTGGQSKLCKDRKRLAVVAAGDVEGTIYLLEVTPATLSELNKYQKTLAQRGIPPEVVVTNLSFDPNASFPKLLFNFGGFLDEEAQSHVDTLFGSDPVLEVTGQKVIQFAPKPVAQQLVQQPVQQPVVQQPVQQAAPVEPEKPKKARGFAAAQPTQVVQQPVVQQPVQQPVQQAARVVVAQSDDTDMNALIASLMGQQNADDA